MRFGRARREGGCFSQRDGEVSLRECMVLAEGVRGFNCASSGDNQKLNRSRLRSCWSNARDEGSYTNSAHTSRDKYNLSYVYAVVKFEEQNK